MPKTLHIFDRAAWERHQVRADVTGDNLAFSVLRDGERVYFEIQGEHGPRDYEAYGFRLGWAHPDDLTPDYLPYK